MRVTYFASLPVGKRFVGFRNGGRVERDKGNLTMTESASYRLSWVCRNHTSHVYD